MRRVQRRAANSAQSGLDRQAIAVLLLVGLAGCSTTPSPETSAAPPVETVAPQFLAGMAVDCGPVVDTALCEKAVEVALAAQLNPPPAAAVRIRLPGQGDDCRTWFHPCDAGSVIAVIQSGDTLQDVPLIRTADSWVRLDQVR